MKTAALVLRRCCWRRRRPASRAAAARLGKLKKAADKAQTGQEDRRLNITDAEERQIGEAGQRASCATSSASSRTRR